MSSSVPLSIQKLLLVLEEAFKKLYASLARYDICRGFKFGESEMSIAYSESVADSSHAGIYMLCVNSPVHLTESAAAPGSSCLQSSINLEAEINKQL